MNRQLLDGFLCLGLPVFGRVRIKSVAVGFQEINSRAKNGHGENNTRINQIISNSEEALFGEP